mgnify:CR=1 FL=1
MANSNIPWVDFLFELAVYWLYKLSHMFGITYEEINVWIFCVAWPLSSIGFIAAILYLIRTNRRLRYQNTLKIPNRIENESIKPSLL